MSGSKTMKAIRVSEFGDPSVLKIRSDVTVPKPGPKQVLIRVHACGVNPVDTYIRSGNFFRKPEMPFTRGPTCPGRWRRWEKESLPSRWEIEFSPYFAQGAAIGIPYFTAYRALVHKAAVKPGETVLIHGASGGVGVAACQLSRALGLKVLGTAGTPEGLQLVLKNGAHSAFNHRENGYTDKIMKATGGQGVNVIVEMLSNVNLDKDLKMLAQGGRVIIVGSRGPIQIDPRDIMMKEISVIGVALYFAKPEEQSQCAAFLFSGFEAGWMKPAVGRRYPLADAAKAHHDIIECPGASGKMVLTRRSLLRRLSSGSGNSRYKQADSRRVRAAWKPRTVKTLPMDSAKRVTVEDFSLAECVMSQSAFPGDITAPPHPPSPSSIPNTSVITCLCGAIATKHQWNTRQTLMELDTFRTFMRQN
ncbi:hypothetical protein WMY93_001174 [Mugilogobius chulae]|uniref:Enoyl reductase (ER) domain-containing protein n=1 Tax=Mugilogobius chulae TaxID=88201 RepID=A0AAW0Q2X4_9GOBI